jgi:ABC-type transport system substrate-binding protein
VYEGLFEFHYLKRPYVLQPNLVEDLPEVSKDGLVYTFKLKKGVLFHDSECFPKGKGRELIVDDVFYSLKRLADTRAGGVGFWLLDEKIIGLNEWREKQKQAKATNYDDPVAGFIKLDDYNFQIKLTKPFPQFLYSFAMPYTYLVPREAVDFFGKEFLNNPVGTGPFVITEPYRQTNRIEYVKNPNYRKKLYPAEGTAEDMARGLLKDAGKPLPLVDKLIIHIQSEDQTRWLSFKKGKLDYFKVPKDNMNSVLAADRKLNLELVKNGIELFIEADLDVTFYVFNNEDPLFRNNKKLRQAMSMALNKEELNTLFYNGDAVLAQGIIPPGLAGYEKDFKNSNTTYNLENAKKLLAEAGYPNGKGLPVIKYEIKGDSTSRQIAEHFVKCMKDIGVKVEVNGNTWPELMNKVNTKRAQFMSFAWGADYPDAENFLQLLYGPNGAPGSNASNYNNPEYNKLFEKAATMQDSPERTKIYEKLNRLIAEDMPMIFGVHRTRIFTTHKWLKNWKFSPFDHGNAAYMNVDLAEKQEVIQKL